MNFSVLTLTFIAINIDFFIMLIFLLQQFSTIKVMIGYALAVFALLLVGFVVGDVVGKFLPEWILGILGLLPIYMAFKDDDDEAASTVSKSAIYRENGCIVLWNIPLKETVSDQSGMYGNCVCRSLFRP